MICSNPLSKITLGLSCSLTRENAQFLCVLLLLHYIMFIRTIKFHPIYDSAEMFGKDLLQTVD